MTDPEVRLGEIRQRHAAITHLPWEADEQDLTQNVYGGVENNDFIAEAIGPENRRFIAHAPEDIDWLLGAVGRLQGMLADRVNQVERIRIQLREIAWIDEGEGGARYCTACKQLEHAPDSECWLFLAIRPA